MRAQRRSHRQIPESVSSLFQHGLADEHTRQGCREWRRGALHKLRTNERAGTRLSNVEALMKATNLTAPVKASNLTQYARLLPSDEELRRFSVRRRGIGVNIGSDVNCAESDLSNCSRKVVSPEGLEPARHEPKASGGLTDNERVGWRVLGHGLGRRHLGQVATIVTPDTILRRQLIARKWTYATRRGGVLAEIRRLVVRMAEENPL